jgi:hypothetical protein
MLEQVISTIASWIVAVISVGGYFGVALLMANRSTDCKYRGGQL